MKNNIFRIIHFSDSHEPAVIDSFSAFCDKRIIGFLNSRIGRGRRYNQDFLRQTIRMILDDPPDLVIFTGDASSTGQKSEFDRAFNNFLPLLKSDIPFIYVPGNHDVYVPNRQCRDALKDFYEKMWRGTRSFGSEPFSVKYGGLRFSVINNALPTNPFLSCGRVSPRTVDFLKEECSKNDDSPIVCVGHFPILGNSGFFAKRHGLLKADAIRELLESRKISLSLCGHVHQPYEKMDDAGFGEIIAGSVTKCAAFAEISYFSDKRMFSLKRIRMK